MSFDFWMDRVAVGLVCDCKVELAISIYVPYSQGYITELGADGLASLA